MTHKKILLLAVLAAAYMTASADNGYYRVNERFGFRTPAQADTAQTSLRNSMPEKRYSIANSWTGSYAGPVQSMLYFYRTMKSPMAFADAYDAYTLKVGDLLFASPETFALSLSGRGSFPTDFRTRPDSRYSLSLAGTPNSGVSLGATATGTLGSGTGGNEYRAIGNAAFWTAVDYERYSAKLAFSTNYMRFAPDRADRDNRRTLYHNNIAFISQNFALGGTDSRPAIELIHTFKWEDISRSYNTLLSDSLGTAATNDSVAFQTFKNTLTVRTLRDNVPVMPFSLLYYFEHEYRYHANYIDHSLTRDEMHDHHLHTGFSIFDTRPMANGSFSYDLTGDVFIYGILTSECNLVATFVRSLTAGTEPLTITWGAGGHRDSNTKFITRYDASFVRWTNNFSKFHRLDAQARIALPKRNISLGINFDNVWDMVYIDDNGLPAQASGSTQIVAVDLKADFRFNDIYWENQFVYQYTSNRDIMPLPDFTLYSNLYYYRQFRHAGFQAGIDIRYYTAFYANIFDPYTGLFHTQHTQKIGNYPELGLYANVRVLDGLKIYAEWNCWNSGLFGGDCSPMPGIARTHSRLDIGISWDLNI